MSYVEELEKRVEELERQVSLNTVQEAAALLAERFQWVSDRVGQYLPSGKLFTVRKGPLFEDGLELVIFPQEGCELVYKIPWNSCIDEKSLRRVIEDGDHRVIHYATVKD
jgi:hypothetical protein